MTKEARALLEKAAATIGSLIEEVRDLREKVAFADRNELAEEIALMKAAEGVITYDELLGERDRLVASDDDLAQVKTAMQHFGPGKVGATGTVQSELAPAPLSSDSAPSHIEAARSELEAVIEAL